MRFTRSICSGHELFLSDSSLFVDDAEAYEKYHMEEEPAVAVKKANENSNGDGPSDSATADGDAEVTNVDDGELYIDELNELEASFSKVAIQEPGTDA
ncbi:zinc finger CCCH domain-containing protein 11-like [Malus sylvestris]|uniref:zinc finger CCCH domain-containing protein 11-like n=1 Tax=Malus sylvestris TaxID=3752 RepID=UPI0021AC235C|nr:zinc finger CCCH domain-containing protein 11-like [Malus sylvestris]